MTTLDQSGKVIPDNVFTLNKKRRPARPRKKNMGDATDFGIADDSSWDSQQESFGASAFDFLHPGTVQAEQAALGQPVQSTISILANSAGDLASSLPGALSDGVAEAEGAVSAAASAASNAVSSIFSIGGLLLLGVAVYFVLEVTADRKLKRYYGD